MLVVEGYNVDRAALGHADRSKAAIQTGATVPSDLHQQTRTQQPRQMEQIFKIPILDYYSIQLYAKANRVLLHLTGFLPGNTSRKLFSSIIHTINFDWLSCPLLRKQNKTYPTHDAASTKFYHGDSFPFQNPILFFI